jgi:predicted transcriptional regulator of viral defense system
MHYIELKEKLRDFTVFSLSDIRKLESDFHRRRLNEWQDKGYIKKVVKSHYIFSDLKVDEKVLFEIANRIYDPSYVSFEMALSRYGLIPESVYGVTSASSLRTRVFRTQIADFIYRTVKPELFFGYAMAGDNGKVYKIASAEKALLDYFYLNPSIKKTGDFESIRVNKEVFHKVVDEKKLLGYLGRFKNKALTKRVSDFLEFMKNA